MIDQRTQFELARLDGYVNAIASLDGKIRDFSASASLVESVGGLEQVRRLLERQFLPQAVVTVAEIVELRGGLKDLELRLPFFLLRDAQTLGQQAVLDRQKYLAFRIMEMIEKVFSVKDIEMVFEARLTDEPGSSLCSFFVIGSQSLQLLLQFNDDRPFKNSL